MNRRALGAAGAAALVLAAIIYAACSGVSSQEPTEPVPSRIPPSSESGRALAEAGAPTGEPTVVGPTAEPAKPEAEVVYIGPRDVKALALTFDTGVPAGHVPEILDTLKEHGKLATFGITGEWAVTNPGLLKRIVEEGHAVINHSWSHASFTGEDTETEPLTVDQMRDELNRTEEKIQEIAGVSTKPYFRPPYGDYDKLVNQAVREAGYDYNVLWLVDSLGWEGRSVKSVVNVTLANAVNGAIFLYHTDNPRDAAALGGIIEGLNERGFQMVTIPQLLGNEPMPTPGPTPAPEPTVAPPPPPSAPAVSSPLPPPPTPAPSPTSAPAPTPSPVLTRLAFDGFEGGGRDGGSGWLGPWQASELFIIRNGDAHSGSYQLDMSFSGFVYRVVDLTGRRNVHLRFWTRLSNLQVAGQAIVAVSSDGSQWEVVKEFAPAEADGVYRLYDVDLSGIAMTGSFTVAFQSQMSPLIQQWDLDDVEFATLAP